MGIETVLIGAAVAAIGAQTATSVLAASRKPPSVEVPPVPPVPPAPTPPAPPRAVLNAPTSPTSPTAPPVAGEGRPTTTQQARRAQVRARTRGGATGFRTLLTGATGALQSAENVRTSLLGN